MIDLYADAAETAVTSGTTPSEPVQHALQAPARGVDTDDVVDMLRELRALGRLLG